MGRVITGNLKIISDSRMRSIIAKSSEYRFPTQTDFQKYREKNVSPLNEYCSRWPKPKHVECDASDDWKLNILRIIDRRISFYSQNTNMLPHKPKISYRYLKLGIQGWSWFQQIKLQTTLLLLFDCCTSLTF